MQNKKWIVLCENYNGLIKVAVNKLCGFISGKIDYVLTAKTINEATKDELENERLIVVGKSIDNGIFSALVDKKNMPVPKKEQGYTVYVGESAFSSEQIIAVLGYDDEGVLYGVIDFINRYCGVEIYKNKHINLMEDKFFDGVFDRALVPWLKTSAPAIKTRALWTWGHVIYDYRKYLDNMAQLRLNEIVIWNDVVPFNAKDVVKYAHSLGIKVVWGFAWGWALKCEEYINNLTREKTEQLKSDIINKYLSEYANTGADGIYFQSFTELNKDVVGDKCVAQIVTDLVNDVAGALLEKEPNLHIQFGLHATSVKNRLEILKEVDKRVYIVWEDCGDFPYHYRTDAIDDFEKTMQFTEKLVSLRGGNESFGTVLKGLVNLDWAKFYHFDGGYVLGERTMEFFNEKTANKERIWRQIQADWLKNAEYVRKTIELISSKVKAPIVQWLVEDAMFENKIFFPIALASEIMWTPESDVGELMSEVARFVSVKFANL